jgi:hypothetical protein
MKLEALTIWTNASFPPPLAERLVAAVAPHRLVYASEMSSLNLAVSPPDAQLAEADIAFGQPDAAQVIDLPTLRWVHLTPGRLACVDAESNHDNTNKPSQEAPFHLAVYRRRPDVNAIVHLHAPDSVALSCLEAPEEAPPLTPYYFSRALRHWPCCLTSDQVPQNWRRRSNRPRPPTTACCSGIKAFCPSTPSSV